MPRSPRVVPAAIAGAVIVALALAGAGAPVLGAGHAVRIVDKNAGSYGESAFSPRSISIRAGDRVTWTNDSTTQHNVTFATFASATYMEPGTRYGHTFSGPGTFRYTCTLHGFTGTVIVTGTAVTPKPTAKPTPAVRRVTDQRAVARAVGEPVGRRRRDGGGACCVTRTHIQPLLAGEQRRLDAPAAARVRAGRGRHRGARRLRPTTHLTSSPPNR